MKRHRLPGARSLLAVADAKLVGKRVEAKGLVLDLSTGFYDGTPSSPDELLREARTCAMINLVGTDSVSLGLRLGLVQKDQVNKVAKVPFAYVLFSD
jgi:hypothetical protein